MSSTDLCPPGPDQVPKRINEAFAQYTQSTAFTLNLGRTHVQALAYLLARDQVWSRADLTLPALRGLERRGLIEHVNGNTRWDLTQAGLLVVLLLVEAAVFPPEARQYVDDYTTAPS